MAQLDRVHVGGVVVGSLRGGGLFNFRRFLGLFLLGGDGRFFRCGGGGGFSHSGRIVSGLGGIGLRLDLVLRTPNMLVLVVVMLTVLQNINGSAHSSGAHGQTGQVFQ